MAAEEGRLAVVVGANRGIGLEVMIYGMSLLHEANQWRQSHIKATFEINTTHHLDC